MTYENVHETAMRWGVTERRVTALCRKNRVGGAKKSGNTWLIPSDTQLPLDGRTKEYADIQRLIYNQNITAPIKTDIEPNNLLKRKGLSNAHVKFIELYHKKPDFTVFTPYRICPLGAHVDHQLGEITGFAIDKGIHIAYGAKQNGVIEISSLQFPKRAQWHVTSTPTEKQNDWADHLRGATIVLSRHFPLRVGLCAIIDGELPIGGLSSSAAVIISFLTALCKLNNINISARQLIDFSKLAENKYVGVSCGKLDQSCEMYCKKDHLLYLDTKTDSYQLLPVPANLKPFKIAVFFSGLERSLASSKFNMRVDECRSAAYALKAFSDAEYGKFDDTNLSDVSYDTFLKYKHQLPKTWLKRAEHFYSEQNRVKAGVQAWINGDIEKFGSLVFESGFSSINNWETGSAELIKLYEIMTKTEGIYGGRFSGAGFKGCCIAIINPDFEQSILETVETEYLKEFPHLKGKYSAYVCATADGVNSNLTK